MEVAKWARPLKTLNWENRMAQEASGQKNPKPFNHFLRYSSLGLQLVVSIGAAGWLGHWLDGKMELRFPVFLLSFVFITFGVMLFQLYRSLNK
ncbi:MAG: hypothetical protein C0523_08125 [Cytophaga sp.]|nr:hypothetical protein [Cytophaga sp.]